MFTNRIANGCSGTSETPAMGILYHTSTNLRETNTDITQDSGQRLSADSEGLQMSEPSIYRASNARNMGTPMCNESSGDAFATATVRLPIVDISHTQATGVHKDRPPNLSHIREPAIDNGDCLQNMEIRAMDIEESNANNQLDIGEPTDAKCCRTANSANLSMSNRISDSSESKVGNTRTLQIADEHFHKNVLHIPTDISNSTDQDISTVSNACPFDTNSDLSVDKICSNEGPNLNNGSSQNIEILTTCIPGKSNCFQEVAEEVAQPTVTNTNNSQSASTSICIDMCEHDVETMGKSTLGSEDGDHIELSEDMVGAVKQVPNEKKNQGNTNDGTIVKTTEVGKSKFYGSHNDNHVLPLIKIDRCESGDDTMIVHKTHVGKSVFYRENGEACVKLRQNTLDVDGDIDKWRQETHDVDDGTVTLRRNNKTARFSNNVEKITDDDYRYVDFLETSTTSRRKIEIGSEKMISDADLKLAATLVHDAMEGRTVDIKTEPRYVRSYNRYKAWPLTYLLYLAIVLDLSLVLFEEPAVPGLQLEYWVTMGVELLCLVYFTVRTVHHFHWRMTSMFIRDMKNIFIILILVITFCDMLCYVVLKQFYPSGRHVRYSRLLRAVIIVNFSDGRQIRRAWRNMRRTIKEIIHVVALFYFFIFVFALIAFQIFSVRDDITYPDGSDYFKNYMDCVWDLYVLVTTSNNPDVMLPAVDKNRFYCLFFFIYILVCFYMLLNVFLAVAYHSYNMNMKDEIRRSSRDKKRKLGQAFDVIKIINNGEDMVTYRIWKRLMKLVKPNLSKHQIDLLMLIVDTNRSGHIGRREFMNVADLLNVPVSEVDDRTTWLEKHFEGLYNSLPSEYVKSFVDSVFFKVIYDLAVVLEVFLIAFNVDNIEVPFCMLYLLEIFLKIYTYGLVKFLKYFGNWFDLIITGLSLAFMLADTVITTTNGQSVLAVQPRFSEIYQAVKVIRIFRILRLLVHIQRFKVITDTLVNISLSILMYCGILFIIFYVFAVIGMEVFQGRIRYFGYDPPTNITYNFTLWCGAPELEGSVFYESKYCSLNFNDILSATLVLSTVLFENNWHVLTEGYVLVTNKAARVYFAVFFMCVSVIVMNIVTAFVVDMFMYEYTIQKEGKVDSTIEKKIKELGLGIDAETGLEISQPMTDSEMRELLKDDNVAPPVQHPWIQNSTLRGLRNADMRFSRFSTYVHKRKSSVPTLSRFDGIRFHIKKRGWTKIEVLLQQLYDVENDIDVTINFKDKTEENKAKSTLL